MPLVVTLAAFFAWSTIGLALLAVLRADTRELRMVLTAPVLGTTATMVPLFLFSEAGLGMQSVARPTAAVMLLGSAVIIAWRRPRLPVSAVPVLGVCLAYVVLVGRPFFTFGFHWLSNANEDMANYVLSATKLLHGGLLAPLDIAGIAHDHNYPTALQALHNSGTRPGSDIMLAAFSAVVGRPPYAAFMPLILAFGLCALCGAAALAMQAANKAWAALLAAVLLAASPLQAYGVLQELLPQVWALGLATALFAILMRSEVHRRPRPKPDELVPIVLLSVTIVVAYIELASTLLLGYALFLGVLLARRELRLRSVLMLWATPLVGVLVILNSYLFRELDFISGQAGNGLRANPGGLFTYTLVPSTLPGILGLQVIPARPTTPHLNLTIALAIVLLALVGGACVVTIRRGGGAALMLLADLALGAVLAARSSDFGLFKLYMYVQPFLAAAAAVWLSSIARRALLGAAIAGVAALLVAQLRTENSYVRQSRNPVDLRHASGADVLPAFTRAFADTSSPFVVTTDIPFLVKLIASTTGRRPVYFTSADYFERLIQGSSRADDARYRALSGWRRRSFESRAEKTRAVFKDNQRAAAVLGRGRCTLVVQSGSGVPFNRRTLPEGSRNLLIRPCGSVRNILTFVPSTLGQSPYLFASRRRVAVYQLEPDYFFRGHTFAGIGRYALFRVLAPSAAFRLELDVTTTVRQDGSNVLPPAAVIGTHRVELGLLGRGSARVFSPVIRPETIGGEAYVLLDMGAEGSQAPTPHPGLQGLYGRNVRIDPRFLTGYLRDVSVLTARQYAERRPPRRVTTFPGGLANPSLAYSGIFEDGWVGDDSYLVLGRGPAEVFRLRAAVPIRGGNHLRVEINGRIVLSRHVPAGRVDIRVPVQASRRPRRVTISWSRTMQLAAPDRRRAAAQLEYVGFG